MSKDLISNIKLMFFVPTKYIKNFYNDIKTEYNAKSYMNFFKYIEKLFFGKLMAKNMYGIFIN